MKSVCKCVIVLALGTGPLASQTTPALSLNQLVAIALDNNSNIRLAERGLSAAKAERRGSYAGLIPSLQASMNRDMDPKAIQLASGYTVEPEPYSSSMSISQTLFDGGAAWYNRRDGKYAVAAAQAQQDQTHLQVVLGVKQAYYRLLSNQELLEVAREALELSRRQLELVEERYRLQAVRESDLLKARVSVGQREADYHRAVQALAASAADLNVVVGQDPHLPINAQRDTLSITPIPDREMAYSLLSNNNPTLRAQDLAVERAWLNAKAQRGVMLPTVSLSYSGNALGREMGAVFSLDSLSNNSATRLNIYFPLFTGMRNSSNYSRMRYAALAEEERLELTELDLKRQLENTLLDLEALHKIHPITQDVLASAEADVRLADEQYRLGAISILDLLDAQVSLITARSSMVRTTYDIKIAAAQLDALMGTITE
ncbi:MAG: TolC family protein [Candidatus Neomarinimicrobiota bacterium]